MPNSSYISDVSLIDYTQMDPIREWFAKQCSKLQDQNPFQKKTGFIYEHLEPIVDFFADGLRNSVVHLNLHELTWHKGSSASELLFSIQVLLDTEVR